MLELGLDFVVEGLSEGIGFFLVEILEFEVRIWWWDGSGRDEGGEEIRYSDVCSCYWLGYY